MENWDDLKFLLAVHKTGTMVSAAKQLGTNAATVSRRIERLAHSLGVAPFIKRSGDWDLNPAIEDLLHLTEEFEARLQSEQNKLAVSSESTRNVRVRIGAPPIVLRPLLTQNAGAFHSAHPEYQLELHNRTSIEGLGDMDIVVMDVPPMRGKLMTRRVGAFEFEIFSYPDSPDDRSWIGLVAEHEEFEPMRCARAYFQCPPTIRTATFFDALDVARSSRIPVLLPRIIANTDPQLPNRTTRTKTRHW